MSDPDRREGWLRALLAGRTQAAPAPRADRALLALAFAAGFAVALIGHRLHRQQVASITDEFAYLLQADTFARGRLSLPAPAQPEFFEAPHVLVEPAYMAKYFPGQAALLAPLMPLGGAWLLPCLLTGAAAALLYWTLRQARAPIAIALCGPLLLLASGQVQAWFPSYLSHALSTTLVIAAAALAGVVARRRSSAAAAGLGACAAWALLTRPLTGMALAMTAGLLLLLLRAPGRLVLAAALPLVAAAALLLGFQKATTGQALLSPWALWARQYMPFDAPGIGAPPRVEPERRLPPHLEQVSARHLGTRKGHTLQALPRITAARFAELPEFLPHRALAVLSVVGLLAAAAHVELAFAAAFAALLFCGQLSFHADLRQYQSEYYPATLLLCVHGAWILWTLAHRRPDGAALIAALAICGATLAFYGAAFGTQMWPAIAVAGVAAAAVTAAALPTTRALPSGRWALTAVLAFFALLLVANQPEQWTIARKTWVYATPEVKRFEALARSLRGQPTVLFVRYPLPPAVDLPIVNFGLGVDDPNPIVAVDLGAQRDARLLASLGRRGFVLDAGSWTLNEVARPP